MSGKHVHPKITAIVVPGSRTVKHEAEALGLDKIFKEAGFEWREPGCSMCLGMNPDQFLKVFIALQQAIVILKDVKVKAHAHLVSPAMAAAAAIVVNR